MAAFHCRGGRNAKKGCSRKRREEARRRPRLPPVWRASRGRLKRSWARVPLRRYDRRNSQTETPKMDHRWRFVVCVCRRSLVVLAAWGSTAHRQVEILGRQACEPYVSAVGVSLKRNWRRDLRSE